MRILILHNFYQHPGGEDTVVQQEANELKKKGHEVLILTAQNRKGIKGILQFGLYPYNIIATNKLFRHINTFEPDIIHIHNLHYAIGPYLIRKLKKQGYPIVMTLHNFRLICPSATMFYRGSIHTESITENFPWTAVKAKALDHSFLKTLITAYTYYIHRATWKLVDKFIVMTTFNKQIFTQSKIGLLESKIEVKPNFIELSNQNPSTERTSHFLYIGRISEEKGIRQLISHFQNKNYSLKVIGDGPIAKELKSKTKHSINIQWLGHQNKNIVAQEISKCKAVIVPSVCFEGAVPLTILESIALKTPVIASEIGTIPAMIKTNVTGWLFDPYSEKSLFEAIKAFEQHKDIESIIDNAIQELQAQYEKKTVINNLINIYQQILT